MNGVTASGSNIMCASNAIGDSIRVGGSVREDLEDEEQYRQLYDMQQRSQSPTSTLSPVPRNSQL